ncbi:MAG: T9SS type A sorting domain-containing protein [Taibaiella sp.]|nr:T9SS type A sorting domain-containing protein [Taibaiella sp.]
MSQSLQWAKTILDTTQTIYSPSPIATDNHHNILHTITTTDNIHIGSTFLTHHGLIPDLYLMKYDSSGRLVWINDLKISNKAAFIKSISVDKDDNIYVAGTSIADTLYINATDYIANPTKTACIFLIKYTSGGSVIWHTSSNTSGPAYNIDITGLTLDINSNILLTGYFDDTLVLSGKSITLPVASNVSVFIAKYGSDGNIKWLKRPDTCTCSGSTIASDENGNIYTGGFFASRFVWGSTVLGTPLTNIKNGWVAKLDTAGNMLWANAIGSPSDYAYDNTWHVVADKKGYVFASGYLDGAMVAGFPTTKYFFSGYNTTGTRLWYYDYVFADGEDADALDIDANGYPYLSVTHNLSANVGGIVVPKSDSGGSFIGKFDKLTGNAIWIINPSSLYFSAVTALSVDKNGGNIAISGSFTDTLKFGGLSLFTPAYMYSNVFISRLYNPVLGTTNLETNNSLFTIYPNPAHDIISVKFVTAGNKILNVTDVNGKLLINKLVSDSNNVIDISLLLPGIYYLSVIDKNFKRQYRQFIKI